MFNFCFPDNPPGVYYTGSGTIRLAKGPQIKPNAIPKGPATLSIGPDLPSL